jgi:hypothetical protein
MTEILLPMNCSLNLRPFLVAADFWRDNTGKTRLRLLQPYEMPFGGSGAAAQLPSFTADHVDAAQSWRGCPWCGAVDTRRSGGPGLLWSCGACRVAGRSGLNCAGRDKQGRSFCACGVVATSFQTAAIQSRAAVAQQVVAIETVTLAVRWR